MSEKVRENYLRRKAARLGLVLRKSRGKQWSIDNQLGYMIVLAEYNAAIQGSRFDLDLGEVEEYLNWYEKDLRESEAAE